MRNVTVTLAVGIALIAAVGAVTLTHSPPRIARIGVPGGDAGNTTTLASTPSDITVCQPHEALPAGVTGIRLAVWAFYGAQIHVRVYSSDSQLLTEGKRGPDWTSDSVTVPVKPLDHATSNVQLCFAIGPNSQPMLLLGTRTQASETASAAGGDIPTPAAAASEHEHLGGRVGVEYLAAGRHSWWSQVLSVSRRLGLGRSFSGTWIALLLAALMAAVGVLAVRLTLRELP